ncbi:MAG: hypothetical protein COA84_00345 [Robiginitomaculum sp.]|nr:MAG: hypothetical protein COA84_00345 [Robiginitomaculum sp.]
MDITLFLSLLGFAFATTMTPGPNNFLLMSSGALFGWRRTVIHIIGVQLGFVAMLVASVFGLGVIMQNQPWLVTGVKVLGAIWLFWLALQFFIAARNMDKVSEISGIKARSRPFNLHEAALFQLANPKALVMSISSAGVYIGLADAAAMRALIIGGTFFCFGIVSSTTWTLAGSFLNRYMSSGRSAVILNLVMGLLLAATALVILRY